MSKKLLHQQSTSSWFSYHINTRFFRNLFTFMNWRNHRSIDSLFRLLYRLTLLLRLKHVFEKKIKKKQRRVFWMVVTVKRCKHVERQLNTELEMEEFHCFCFPISNRFGWFVFFFLTGILSKWRSAAQLTRVIFLEDKFQCLNFVVFFSFL